VAAPRFAVPRVVAKLRPIQRRPADPEPREIDVMSVGRLE
jgi:hypothetical protein